MTDDNFRGIGEHQEQRARKLVRDTRPLTTKFASFVRDSRNATGILCMLGIFPFIMPTYFDVSLILGILTFIGAITKKNKLPFRMPETSGELDFNDPLPGSTKPRKARGICYFGNDRESGHELWFNNDDMRTHVLIFGSTGSGKTEALVSIAYNALVQGSGFIYVDGKGDNSLYAKVYSMCRTMGREDDLLLINFMTGARDIVGPQKSRISNTVNPFSRGSSGMLSNLVVSMMDSGGSGNDGDMWKGRAISFVEALMKILVYMRDQGHILLDANSIRLYFSLPKLESIAIDRQFPVSDDRMVDIKDAPDVVVEPIFNYLQTLPGYNTANKGKQSGEVWEQHGFITMQLTKIFSSLADTYGHIIRTNLAEVDFKDIVLNRRILVVLLPALEKSPEELSNLGKIIVASLKGMMASGLGEEVEGTYREVIERKPTNSPTPYLCVLDEYGYYAVQGFAVVPAQARSLGFSAIFAGQDLPAFQKASKEEAASIGANTNIKLCMKLEDPTDTFEFFQKTAGQAYVTRTGGFQTNNSGLTNTYLDNKSAQIEKQDRIELADLKDQREGELHIFFKSKIVRARVFYANPPATPRLKLNQQLKIEDPSDEDIAKISNRLFQFDQLLNDPNGIYIESALDEDLQKLRDYMQGDTSADLAGAAAHAVKALYDAEIAEEQQINFADDYDPDFKGMDIFTQSNQEMPDFANFDPMRMFEIPALVGPLLDKREARKHIEKIERFLGSSKGDATAIADKLIGDLRTATHYPPSDPEPIQMAEVINNINELCRHFAPGSVPSDLAGGGMALPPADFSAETNLGAVDPMLGIDPMLGGEPIPGTEPSLGTESIPGIDPILGTESFSGIDPVLSTDAVPTLDPMQGAETLPGTEPMLGAETLPDIGLPPLSTDFTAPPELPPELPPETPEGSTDENQDDGDGNPPDSGR